MFGGLTRSGLFTELLSKIVQQSPCWVSHCFHLNENFTMVFKDS